MPPVLVDLHRCNGVVHAEDHGIAIEGLGVKSVGAGDDGAEGDHAGRISFGFETSDVAESDFAFLECFTTREVSIGFSRALHLCVEHLFRPGNFGGEKLAE